MLLAPFIFYILSLYILYIYIFYILCFFTTPVLGLLPVLINCEHLHHVKL